MRKLVLLILVLISYQGLFGQAGQLDSSFNPVPDIPAFVAAELATGSVTKYVKQSDGKIIAIGTFAGAIRRFNADGTVDAGFIGPSITGGFIKDIALFFNDQAMVVGNMVTSNTGNHYLALLNLDGTVATSFPKYVPAGNIDHVSVNANGSLVMIAGSFSSLSVNNGAFQPRTRFALIGIDGTFFSNNPGIDGTINQVFKDAQGRHLFVGDFTTFNGLSYPRIFRLDNNFGLDETFTVGAGFTGAAYTVTQQADGKYLVGGDMTAYNGQSCQRLVRLNENGTYDNTFTPSTFDNRVLAVAASASGKVFAGGSFINYNGANQYRLVGLNANGSLNPTFSVATALNGNVNYLLAMDGERVLVAGAFDNFKGAVRRNPLLLNQYGNRVSHNEAGISGGAIVRMAEQADGKIIIGGSFTDYRGVPLNGLARLHTNGTVDNTFNIGTGFSNSVNAIAIQADGKIIVGGSFTTFNGQAQLRLVRLNMDGSKDDSFTPVSLNNDVLDIKIDTSIDKIYIAGGFGLAGGNGFTRLNSDGSKDDTFNTPGGANNAVTRIHLYEDGKILLSGLFSSFNGNATVGKLVRLNADGTVDTGLSTSSGGVGFDTYSVSTMVVQADGKIIVGGNFPYYQRAGVTTNSKALMRLNSDGSFDNTFLYNNGFNTNASVSDIVIHPTGQIAVSGNLANYGATNVNHFAYFEADGTFIPSAVNGSNFSSSISDLLLLNNGKLLASGGFANYNSQAHHGIVLLENPCSESTQLSQSICQGDQFVFGSQTLTTAGVFTEVFTNQLSCDSTVTLTLNIIPVNFSATRERCTFETLTIEGQEITSYGDFEFIIPRSGTCDSVVTVSVVPSAIQQQTVNASICEGDSYVFTINALDEQGDPYEFNSPALTTAGNYQYSLFLGEQGCETQVSISLVVNPVYNLAVDRELCITEGFVFGDETIFEAGEYTKLFESSKGCDSTVVLTLNLQEESIFFNEETLCISASTNQSNYRIYRNDELIASGLGGNIDYPVTACGDYQAVFGGPIPSCNIGLTLWRSGSGECTAGAQTWVNNATLPLQINLSSADNPEGINFTQNSLDFNIENLCSKVYTLRITDANACVLNFTFDYADQDYFGWSAASITEASCEVFSNTLAVNFQQSGSAEATICEGELYAFGGQNYSQAGVYEALFTSSTGCDSLTVLTLSVTPNPIIPLTYDAQTKRLSATNSQYNSYKLYKDEVVIASSASSGILDYATEDCGEYHAEFGTVSCHISISGNRTGSNQCNYSYNLNITNVAMPYQWEAASYTFNAFFGSTTLQQKLEGTSNTNALLITGACVSTYTNIIITDASGCTQFIQVGNANAGNIMVDGGEPTLPTCISRTNVFSIQHDTEEQRNLELCATETYQFGSQLISESGVYTELFTTATGCDSTVVLSVSKFEDLVIVSQPQSSSICETSSLTLSIEATGKALSYIWYKNGSDIAGANSASITLENLSTADAAEYSVLVMDDCGNSESSEIATVVVTPAPAISQQPAALSVCPGENANFSIVVDSQTASNFQWRKNGVAIDGATGTSFSINTVSASDAGDYTVQFTEECGTAISAIASLTIYQETAITAQPQALTLCQNGTASLSVSATGGNLNFQWLKDGSPIENTNVSTLFIEGANLADAGLYSVQVTGACGVLTSEEVAVVVNAATIITNAPQAQTVCVGDALELSVSATGTGALSYQWRKNGAAIPNATEATYSLASSQAADAGNYSVEVSGACGSVTNEAVAVGVSDNRITITAQPASRVLCEGDVYINNVISTGPVTAYQWYKDGVLIPGATTSAFTINGATAADAGAYTVQFIGGCNSPMSEVATVVVNPSPVVYEQPTAQYRCFGDNVVITPNIKLNDAFTYNWLRNETGFPVYSSSTTSADFVLNNFQSSDVASYILEIVSPDCGTLRANPMVVLSIAEVVLQNQPQSQQLCEGDTEAQLYLFVDNLNDNGPHTYQWFKDGTAIEGANSNVYSKANLTQADAGTYTVYVANACSHATSEAAVITVNQGSTINVPAEICKGESFEYNGSVFTEAGNYQVAYTNETGCSSIANIQLSVTEVNAGITQSGTTLTATQEGASYQWTNCGLDQIVTGATERSFTPNTSGSYAVQITFNECSVQSTCRAVNILGLGNALAPEFSYYPNPFTNQLIIKLSSGQGEVEISLLSLDGRSLQSQQASGTEAIINTDQLKSGMYLLQVKGAQGTSLQKVIKQ